MHIFMTGLRLQELNRSLLEILHQNYVVFADLVVHLALQVVVCLQVARTDPKGLPLQFVGEQADQLHGLTPITGSRQIIISCCICLTFRQRTWLRSESKDREKLNICYCR